MTDRHDSQGVVVEGYREEAAQVVAALQKALPDALSRPPGATLEPWQGRRLSWEEFRKLGGAVWIAEFHGATKLLLDGVRAGRVPTLPGHHHLKVVDPEGVAHAEEELREAPHRGQEFTLRLKEELVYSHYRPGSSLVSFMSSPTALPLR